MGGALQAEAFDDNPVAAAWFPQEGPQTAFCACPVLEIGFGGARGGGKTDAALGDFAIHAEMYGQYAQGVFFRRRAKDLEDVIRRSHEIYPKLGAVWTGGNASHWTWPNGAVLRFRHLWDVKAAQNYQGHSYTRIYFEELTQWPTSGCYNMLRAALRSAHGVPVGQRASFNPGGAGHNWVKAWFITPAPDGYTILIDPKTGDQRVFIPARLEDNKILIQNDPRYENRLRAVGSAALVKAWRWGLWDIVAGGFFDDIWMPDRQIVAPFAPPASWKRRMSFDWGSSAPASLGMWAISDGTQPAGCARHIPPGSFVRIGEWYTVKVDRLTGLVVSNEGLRIRNEDLGAGIAKRASGNVWTVNVADPSIWSEQGGPSIYDQMRKNNPTMPAFIRADNSRIAGWQKMREMLEEAGKDRPERPGLFTFDTCQHYIRTVPVLQIDPGNPDDVDTEGEDHPGDDTRYAVMSVGRGATSQEIRL